MTEWVICGIASIPRQLLQLTVDKFNQVIIDQNDWIYTDLDIDVCFLSNGAVSSTAYAVEVRRSNYNHET